MRPAEPPRLLAARRGRILRVSWAAVDLSKEELAPFDPKDRLYRGVLWTRVVTPDGAFTHFFWGRIALVAAVLAVILWLALAWGVWTFVKHQRGYKEVSYIDLVFYPLRRDHYHAGMGRHQIAAGREAFEKQKFREGYDLINAGLSRVPDDLAARALLANADWRSGRTEYALRTLTAGVPFAANDLDYLKLLFGMLHEAREDERVIEIARDLLPARPDTVLAHLFTALQAATAHYTLGHPEAAKKLIAEWRLENAVEGQILLARCDWDRGLHDLVLQRLEQQIERFPKRDELYLELIRLNREVGRNEEARRFALLRQFNDPDSPGPRIDLLNLYRSSGDTTAGERELEDFFARFSTNSRALLLLQSFAVESIQPELVEKIYTLAQQNAFPLLAFHLARVQVALATRDSARALVVAEEALRKAEAADPTTSLLRALRAVASFGTGDPGRGQTLLTAFLDERRLRAGDALLLARLLKEAGVPAQARRVLEQACQLDPRNQAALTELVRLDAENPDRTALTLSLPKLLALPKPPRTALEDTLRRLDQPTDEALRKQIRTALTGPAQPPAATRP